MSGDELTRTLNWGGWIISNIVFGIFLPVFGMLLMHFLKGLLGSTEIKISYTASFRNGQLGFVSVGWVVGSVIEVTKWLVKHQSFSMLLYVLALLFLAAMSGLVAAVGSVSPVDPERNKAAGKGLITGYPAFFSSVALCVLTLPLAAIVHGKVS
ncbi:hypothetical protein [Paraburkholderia heleia]|uniref:hypothetical protein n=1 Tax=Paraburkholderia heleia TaxID=634127 RepID=UPI0005AAA760|nr:hypothetical protein [Paraburkholderia heleia]